MLNGLTPIANITVGSRHRKDMGDLQALADSIKNQGLLQPIGITEDSELVFGERRLQACLLLGHTEIETRVVNVTSIIEGEYAENELRKDFTRSEQVAIAASIEELLGKRQGERTDLSNEQLVELDPQVPPGQKTRDFVAERAGLGSGKTYRDAKKVVDKGVPELVDAMDAGEVSIKNAAVLARLPHEEQREVLQKPAPEIRQTVKDLRTERTPKESIESQPEPPTVDANQATEEFEESEQAEEPEGSFKPFTQAQQFATIAISNLESILGDDPLRKQALLRVRKWINEQLSKEKEDG